MFTCCAWLSEACDMRRVRVAGPRCGCFHKKWLLGVELLSSYLVLKVHLQKINAQNKDFTWRYKVSSDTFVQCEFVSLHCLNVCVCEREKGRERERQREQVCCMEDASLIFTSGHKSSLLCCSTGVAIMLLLTWGVWDEEVGHCSVWSGFTGFRSPLCSPPCMMPRLAIWILMRGNDCSWGNSSHLARAAVLCTKWSCLTQPWLFLGSSQTGTALFAIPRSQWLDCPVCFQQTRTPGEWGERMKRSSVLNDLQQLF